MFFFVKTNPNYFDYFAQTSLASDRSNINNLTDIFTSDPKTPKTPATELKKFIPNTPNMLNTPVGIDNTMIYSTPNPVTLTLDEIGLNGKLAPYDSLHEIHNFEININLDLDGVGDQPSQDTNNNVQTDRLNVTKSNLTPTQHHYYRSGSTNATTTTSSNNGDLMMNGSLQTPPTVAANCETKSNRRSLNLQEYKRRMGLI